MGIRAVLFDKDGTLIDAFAGWVDINHQVFREFQRRYPHPGTVSDLRAALGMTESQALPGGILASGTEEQIYRAHHRLLAGAAPGWEHFHPEIKALSLKLFQGTPPGVVARGRVKQTLAALRDRGYRLGLATSDSWLNASRDLGPHGAELLEFWATSDRVNHPKPHPESVLRFCEAVGVVSAQVAFVGDSPVDLETARSAGAGVFFAVRSPTCPPGVLALADVVLDTVEDLLVHLPATGEGLV